MTRRAPPMPMLRRAVLADFQRAVFTVSQLVLPG